jgi:uncharacterized damage-inducible protein DinB
MGNPIEVLIYELNRSMYELPWYGYSIQKILEDVKPENVFIKPDLSNHSIYEIGLHILSWNEEVNKRLQGSSPCEPERGDWPESDSNNYADWNELKAKIFSAFDFTIKLIRELPIEKFEEKIGNEYSAQLATGFNYRETILGLMQHNIYHAGQISFLNVALNKLKG